MPTPSQTQTVRQIVADTLANLGLAGAQPCRETVLIRGGVYCGRRFDAENAHAVWFVEEGEIKIFAPDGRVIRVVEPGTPAAARRMAA
jgi:hypothetical protein